MPRYRYLPLLVVVLFCLTSMAGCPNKEPGGQFTVVQGRVINIRTGRPLPGVLVALVSDGRGTSSYNQLEDSVRTDAQGSYALSFTNVEGLYYAVSCEGTQPIYPYLPPYRLDFADSAYITPGIAGTATKSLRTVDLVLGQQNAVKFRASPQRVFRVQVATRNTGYQQLMLANGAKPYPANNQRFTALLYQSVVPFAPNQRLFSQLAGNPLTVTFSRFPATGGRQDTAVKTVANSPLTADTVEASLLFGR